MQRILLLTLGLLTAQCLAAQSNVQKQVADVARKKFDAMIAADIPALRNIFHDSLRYIHSGGNIDTKNSLIEKIRNGQENYQSIQTSQVSVQMFNQNKLAIWTGQLEIVMKGKESEPPLKILVTEVYNLYTKGWQLIRRHSNRLM